MISQMRRAGTSMPANIAEGCVKKGNADFARFLGISMGSASELEYYFILSRDLGYLRIEETEMLMREVIELKRMLTSFIKKLSI